MLAQKVQQSFVTILGFLDLGHESIRRVYWFINPKTRDGEIVPFKNHACLVSNP